MSSEHGCAPEPASERTIFARAVIGADGRMSTFAREVGAKSYAILPTERFGYFAYYEDVPATRAIDIVRDDRLYGFGCRPTTASTSRA